MLYIIINDENERFVDLRYKDVRKDYYTISNYGDIMVKNTGKIIKTFISNSGYKRVGLCRNDSKRKNYSIHVLTASIFYNKIPKKGEQVNHLNGDKFHNYYKNLEIVSCGKNIQHAYDIGLMKSGSDHHLGKFVDDIVHRICRHLESGDDIYTIVSDITNDNNISRSSERYRKWRAYIKKIRQRQFRKDIVLLYDF